MDWRHRAICRAEDPELFYPVGTGPAALAQIAEAKTVCQRCPVIAECRAHALEVRQAHGVWGGLSEAERFDILARRADVQRRTVAHPTPGARQAIPASVGRIGDVLTASGATRSG